MILSCTLGLVIMRFICIRVPIPLVLSKFGGLPNSVYAFSYGPIIQIKFGGWGLLQGDNIFLTMCPNVKLALHLTNLDLLLSIQGELNLAKYDPNAN